MTPPGRSRSADLLDLVRRRPRLDEDGAVPEEIPVTDALSSVSVTGHAPAPRRPLARRGRRRRAEQEPCSRTAGRRHEQSRWPMAAATASSATATDSCRVSPPTTTSTGSAISARAARARASVPAGTATTIAATAGDVTRCAVAGHPRKFLGELKPAADAAPPGRV